MKTIQSNDELEVKNLTKIFNDKNNNLIVFKDVNLSFKSGEINFICGKSGSGKTTFLSIIGGLSLPTTGDIYFNDEKYFSSNDKVQKLDKLRNDYVSFVFQDFNLINDFSALDNLLVLKAPKEDALNILKIIGLEDKANIKAKFLSGGEKQRLAIGRALIKISKIIILDETIDFCGIIACIDGIAQQRPCFTLGQIVIENLAFAQHMTIAQSRNIVRQRIRIYRRRITFHFTDDIQHLIADAAFF